MKRGVNMTFTPQGSTEAGRHIVTGRVGYCLGLLGFSPSVRASEHACTPSHNQFKSSTLARHFDGISTAFRWHFEIWSVSIEIGCRRRVGALGRDHCRGARVRRSLLCTFLYSARSRCLNSDRTTPELCAVGGVCGPADVKATVFSTRAMPVNCWRCGIGIQGERPTKCRFVKAGPVRCSYDERYTNSFFTGL